MAAAPNANLDPATRQALAARLRFYRDLGMTEFYRRPVDLDLIEKLSQSAASELKVEVALEVSNDALSAASSSTAHDLEETAIPPRKPIAVQPEIAPPVALADRAGVEVEPSATLRLRAALGLDSENL